LINGGRQTLFAHTIILIHCQQSATARKHPQMCGSEMMVPYI
jgi:hypothetical protein